MASLALWALLCLGSVGLTSIIQAGESAEEVEYSEKYGEPISAAQVAVIESWRTDDPSWWQDPAVVATARDLSARIYRHYYEALDDDDFVARVDGDPDLFGVEALIDYSRGDYGTPPVAERIKVEFHPALRPDLFVWSDVLMERVMDFAAGEGTLIEGAFDHVKSVSGSKHLQVADAIGLGSWDTGEDRTLAFFQAFKEGFRNEKSVLHQEVEEMHTQLTASRLASDAQLTALDLYTEHLQSRSHLDAFADQVCALALQEISSQAKTSVVHKLTQDLLTKTVEFRLIFPPLETRDRILSERNAALQSLASDSE